MNISFKSDSSINIPSVRFPILSKKKNEDILIGDLIMYKVDEDLKLRLIIDKIGDYLYTIEDTINIQDDNFKGAFDILVISEFQKSTIKDYFLHKETHHTIKPNFFQVLNNEKFIISENEKINVNDVYKIVASTEINDLPNPKLSDLDYVNLDVYKGSELITKIIGFKHHILSAIDQREDLLTIHKAIIVCSIERESDFEYDEFLVKYNRVKIK